MRDVPNPLLDVAAWKDGFPAFVRRIKAAPKNDVSAATPRQMIRIGSRVDPRFVYALFVEFISPRPNGPYTAMLEGLPVDNPFWWDFLLTHDDYLFDVSSGVNGLEAHIFSVPEGFDVERFLLASTSKHAARVRPRADAFERHQVWVNHYRSYRDSLHWLREEVASIDDSVPAIRGGHFNSKEDAERELQTLEEFQRRVVRFHVLAKSLLVNAAFMCEALVSTLIRVAALPPLKQDPERLLHPILRAPFSKKVEVLHAYTVAFAQPIDMSAAVVKKAQSLMDMRNQYVHSELADHTRLEDVYFDGMFPLYRGAQLTEYAKRAYLTPTKQDVLDAATTAFAFDEFIRGCVRPDLQERVAMHLEQGQISYNTQRRIYSIVFPSSPYQFHMVSSVGDANEGDSDEHPPAVPSSEVTPKATTDQDT